MAASLSYPFRIGAGGKVATVEPGSPEANGELLQVLILTRIGDRPLAPTFGISDPQFAGVEPTEITAGIAAHGPDVTVNDLTATQQDAHTVVVHLDYS